MDRENETIEVQKREEMYAERRPLLKESFEHIEAASNGQLQARVRSDE